MSVEAGYRPDLIEALASRGHNITTFDINIGIAEVQAVVRQPSGKIYGASSPPGGRQTPAADDALSFAATSDSRKNGIPAAY